MSNMDFPNFNSKANGLRFDFSTNKLKCSAYLSRQTPLPESFEMLLPDSFECLSDPQQSFGNPLRALFLKNRDFFLLRRNFLPLYVGTSKLPPRVLAVWAKTLPGQKPCGSKLLTLKLFLRLRIDDVFYSKQINLSMVSYLIPLIYGGCYSKGLIDSIFQFSNNQCINEILRGTLSLI